MERTGVAWTAVPAKDDGTCPRYPDPEGFIVAADHTGDAVADSWVEFDYGCYNGCAPWDATDLDASGTEELIVATYFSIMDYHFFAVRPGPNGDLRLEPVLVAIRGMSRRGSSPGNRCGSTQVATRGTGAPSSARDIRRLR